MENIGRSHPPYNSESLKQTLNCYQLSSVDSLSGPSSHYALAAHLFYKENKQSPPIPPPPLIQIPLLVPNDTSTIRSQTQLAGESVSCFIVGGEKRLCLPQILSTVLRDYSISEINRTCADLHIYCSRCSPEQLEYLKKFGILPFNATQCGLISKSDAERLVASLGVEYHLNTKQTDFSKLEGKGFRVYHRCFGRADGQFFHELYTSPDSPCITCIDCVTTFSPARFVAHSHRGLEKRTCHWGFDPENWRHYLLVPKEQGNSEKCENEKLLEAMKAKFDVSNMSKNMSPLKRRQQEPESEQYNKRLKDDPSERSSSVFLSPQRLIPPYLYGSLPLGIRPSAFKPWAEGLQSAAGASLPPDVSKSIYDEAMKALQQQQPMLHGADRRLLPGLVQLGSGNPGALSSAEAASEWSNLMAYSNVAPNIKLVPSGDKQKKLSSGTPVPSSPAPSSKDYSLKRQAVPPSLTSIVKVEQLDDGFARDNSTDNKKSSLCSGNNEHRLSVSRDGKINHHHHHHYNSNTSTELVTKSSSKSSSYLASCQTASALDRSLPVSSVKTESSEVVGRWSTPPTAKSDRNNETKLEQTARNNSQQRGATDLSTTSSTSSSSHRDKPIPPLLAMSKAVAAASAMLELSSSGNNSVAAENSIPKQSKAVTATAENLTSSTVGSDAHRTSATTASAADHYSKDRHHQANSKGNSSSSSSRPSAPLTLMVMPIDKSHQHFKWSFGSESYFISASGTQDLKQLNSLLDDACHSDVSKHQVLKELVKIKAKYEEKLDIQARVKKDLETELEHTKVSKRKRLEEASSARRELRREIERLRDEHNEKMTKANETIALRDKQISELKKSHNTNQSRDSNDVTSCTSTTSNENQSNRLEEKLDKLQRKLQEQQSEMTSLRSQLIVEKDEREELETKLKEISERSGGRLPFLMDGPLSTMIREARKKDDVTSGGSGSNGSSSISNRQRIESFASSICKHSSIKTALEHDCHSKGDEYRGEQQRTPVKLSGRIGSGPGIQESINLTTSPISCSSSSATHELNESNSTNNKGA